ncbi:clathrin light chain A-like isoform X2 [Amphiura filiformis]|uniref:clathrin light chain A-like isoform X2 n=1 Tax=Amphiura filiformis TaxID=82378 RepID=UPI003B216338
MADATDFDNLAGENTAPTTGDDDPAAEFLAREQDELAGIDDDNFGVDGTSGSATVEQSGDGDAFPAEENAEGEAQENGPSDLYAAISQVDRQEGEPEKIKKWREEQKEMLENKDSEATTLQDEWKELAQKELDDWASRQTEQLEKTKASNRLEKTSKHQYMTASEEAFVQERDEVTPGQEWERITRLCDFNPKNNKNTKDVTRMRSILLHLKQTGMPERK